MLQHTIMLDNISMSYVDTSHKITEFNKKAIKRLATSSKNHVVILL